MCSIWTQQKHFFFFFILIIDSGSSGRRSSGSRHVSSTTVTSSEAQQQNAQGNLPGVPIPVSNASNLNANAPPPAELVPATGES